MAWTRRQFLQTSVASGAALALPTTAPSRVLGANDKVRIGIIGLGNRGSAHVGWFGKIDGVEIAALCDPDSDRVEKIKKNRGNLTANAKTYTDLRKLMDDQSIDAVVIATCNHWHCLAAIWACQAGKDVYVEKPLGHNQYEQQKLVEAARKYGRVVQLGTQRRTDPIKPKFKKFLHEDKELGEIQYVRANMYKPRDAIGMRDKPMTPPDSVDYNLWLGPAHDEPIYRNKFHYQWHWVWNTGNGDMGNNGVHTLDDVRNVVFQDTVSHPIRVMAGGGRVKWDDAGETPNAQFVYFDTGLAPVMMDVTNLKQKPGGRAPTYKITRIGYTVHCEGGYLCVGIGGGGGVAFDNKGKKIKSFEGTKGEGHAENFIDAVRAQDPKLLNAEIAQGHYSSSWCNLANIAWRMGDQFDEGEAAAIRGDEEYKPWQQMIEAERKRLANHDVDLHGPDVKMSPVLRFNPMDESFHGPAANRANPLLTRYYRRPFVVPEDV